MIFIGIDANYPEDIAKYPEFLRRISEYHQDGVSFWKKYGVHHPFLLDEYPFPKNTGGVPYHRNFRKMELSARYADFISFIELLDVPTTGSTNERVFWRLFRKEHVQAIDNLITNGSGRVVFLSNKVLQYMRKMKKLHRTFNWCPDKIVSGAFSRIGDTVLFNAKHFSAANSNEELRARGDYIKKFCSL